MGNILFRSFEAFRDDPRKVSFALSCGKDSAVMLDLASKYLDLEKHAFFYLTFYSEVLPYKRRYLANLERKYYIFLTFCSFDAALTFYWLFSYKKVIFLIQNYLTG